MRGRGLLRDRLAPGGRSFLRPLSHARIFASIMIDLDRLKTAFSAKVSLELRVGEKVYRLGKSGPG